MVTSPCRWKACLLALLMPSMVSATLAGFTDFGDRNPDRTTGFEWLDVTDTKGMADTELLETAPQARFATNGTASANVSGTPSSYAKLGPDVRDTAQQIGEPPAWAIAILAIAVLLVRLFRDKGPRKDGR